MTSNEIIDALYWIKHVSGLNLNIIPNELSKNLSILCTINSISKEDFINGMLLEIHKQTKLQNFNWLWD